MLQDDVVQALNAAAWPGYVTEQLGPLVGDAVAATLRPVVGALLDGGSDPVVLGGSKVGGLPHVDDAFVWPTEDDTDEPLALVCQLNLVEAAAAAGGGLAGTGMLYLFCIYDSDRAYGYEIDWTTAKLLHVPQPGPLAAAKRPDGLDDDGELAERRIVLVPSLVCERADENGRPCAARFDYAVEEAMDGALLRNGGGSADVVRMLGNPHLFRSEARELVDPLTDTLLLYVNAYAVSADAFGEGEFHVVIDNDALRAGEFEGARIIFEPGT